MGHRYTGKPDVLARNIHLDAMNHRFALRDLKPGWLTARFGPKDVDDSLTYAIEELPKAARNYIYHKSGSWVQFRDESARRQVLRHLKDIKRLSDAENDPRFVESDRKLARQIAGVERATPYGG